ncbi:protein grindelwald [Chelonus insularis]|uniref:protein grindelwald n=1 Tax=Chelonus insularis TaxID=460826 RepID=UPI00158950A3|nr:protein grindelwald [Chelonus insularis]XP_034939510.1 protein grindelwald [Chelonus insularis]
MLELMSVIVLIFVSVTKATLDPSGVKCGQKRCSTTEYCSPFDSQCKPCSLICDSASHNHHPEICVRDCQVYLHDQRYVLRAELDQDGNLRGEIQRLRTFTEVSLILWVLLCILTVIWVARRLLNAKKIKGTFDKIFGKKWIKTANSNRVHDDVENGTIKSQQAGVKPTMPTISASVSASSTQDSNACSTTTPNTTSTPLSKKYASEDSTLEFAYDNLAMTTSIESAQPKSKKESSF